MWFRHMEQNLIAVLNLLAMILLNATLTATFQDI